MNTLTVTLCYVVIGWRQGVLLRCNIVTLGVTNGGVGDGYPKTRNFHNTDVVDGVTTKLDSYHDRFLYFQFLSNG